MPKDTDSTGPLCPNCGEEDMEYLEANFHGVPIYICHWCGYQEDVNQ